MENSDTFGAAFGAAFGRLVKRKRSAANPKWTQGDLAAALYPNIADARDTRKGDISKLETGKVANPHSNTIKKIADLLGISEDEIDALQKQAQMPMAERLNTLDALPRDHLELLASRFEIDRPFDLSDADLQGQLSLKAEEYRAYRKQIEAIDDRVSGLANLKAAAQDAAERLDFDEVENLMLRVDEVETGIAAEAKEIRAANALLRGRARQAFEIYGAAADSFRSVDPLEPARRRIGYAGHLYRHGLRYGGDGLGLAADMWRAALGDTTEAENPDLWAGTQNNLGIALSNQATRLGGEKGQALMAGAITAYRDALRVYTEAAHQVQWAMTQNNLGTALSDQATRLGGEKGQALMDEAITAYRDALQVRTEGAHPLHWTMTQNNLGAALSDQATRLGGDEGQTLMAGAITALRDALRVRTEAAHPVQWAMTQNNLGNALGDQATRLGGKKGQTLMDAAITAYRDALRVRTEGAHPVQWAMTQENLAIVHMEMAGVAGADVGACLNAALEHVDKALTVFAPQAMPYDYDKASGLKERIEGLLAGL